MRPSSNSPERWIAYREANPRARLRMFCFPYAGGGASIYRGWGALLPSDVEVCPIQLPGRETRLREQPYERLAPMILAIADFLPPYLDLPFVFFGHSMGSMISYELTRELRRRGNPLPLHLFVSGRRAPHLPLREKPIYDLPEDEFVEELRKFNGTPEEVLQHEELMKLLMPILRADFAVNDTYTYAEEPPFGQAGISAFGGLGDEQITREDVDGWRDHTRGRFRIRMLPGDHFFVHSARDLILESVARDLAELSIAAPGSW